MKQVLICFNFSLDFVWSLSNDVILSVSKDGTARLWDVAAGSCMRVIQDAIGSELLCCVFQVIGIYCFHGFTLNFKPFWVLSVASKTNNLQYYVSAFI